MYIAVSLSCNTSYNVIGFFFCKFNIFPFVWSQWVSTYWLRFWKILISVTTSTRQYHILYTLIKYSTFKTKPYNISSDNDICGTMVSVLASCVVYRGFECRTNHTKDYNIGFCSFSTKHAELRSKSKDWLVGNQVNVSEWSVMSSHWLLFHWTSTIEIQLSMLV
jgi:hypothetical protein